MNYSISFQHGVSIRFTEPHSSDQLLTIHLGGQEATLSLEETDKLYLWLHQHREVFISFYGKGWELARMYWQRDAAPDTYSALLNLFNVHCHEINVSPYREGDQGPQPISPSRRMERLNRAVERTPTWSAWICQESVISSASSW